MERGTLVTPFFDGGIVFDGVTGSLSTSNHSWKSGWVSVPKLDLRDVNFRQLNSMIAMRSNWKGLQLSSGLKNQEGKYNQATMMNDTFWVSFETRHPYGAAESSILVYCFDENVHMRGAKDCGLWTGEGYSVEDSLYA